MDNVIFYDKYATKLLEKENKQVETVGTIDYKLWNMLNKIFEWDRKLNLLG